MNKTNIVSITFNVFQLNLRNTRKSKYFLTHVNMCFSIQVVHTANTLSVRHKKDECSSQTVTRFVILTYILRELFASGIYLKESRSGAAGPVYLRENLCARTAVMYMHRSGTCVSAKHSTDRFTVHYVAFLS